MCFSQRKTMALNSMFVSVTPNMKLVDHAGFRVVRVGTHALKAGSKSTLWGRLSQHRGTARAGGGNHRGSIFRLLVGIALARRSGIPLPPSWGLGGDPGTAARWLGMERAEVRRSEAELEASVNSPQCPLSALISMVLWRTSRSRARCSIRTDCCSADFTAANRMVGRISASQIASASVASFLFVLTKGCTYCGGISRTACPSARNSRAQ